MFLKSMLSTATYNINTVDNHPQSVSKGKVFNSQGAGVRVTTLLKGLQPQREVPRGKRFAAGKLAGDKTVVHTRK